MHICTLIHYKMRDKEDKWTLRNEGALLKSAAVTFSPGGEERERGEVSVNFNTLLVDSLHAGLCFLQCTLEIKIIQLLIMIIKQTQRNRLAGALM